MNKWIFMPLFLLFFAGVPVLLAMAQGVPAKNTFQLAVLLTSTGAFGLLLGLFWLSRLLPRGLVKMKYAGTLRWHKYIGYAAGAFFMLHPFLMVVRRFWVVESNPVDNFMLMLKSPLMLTGIMAWVLLLVIVVLAFFRKHLPAKLFRYLHGALSIGFVGLSTWHVVSVGRHSNPAMSGFWIALAAGAVAALLFSYLPVRSKKETTEGALHESA